MTVISSTAIVDLIARLEKATGPDRELDIEIWEKLYSDYEGAAPEFTRSMAAALILFPDRSPRSLCIAALRALAAVEERK